MTVLTTISHQVNNFLETIVWEPSLILYRRKKWTNIRRTSVSGDAWYLIAMAVVKEHMAKTSSERTQLDNQAYRNNYCPHVYR